MRYLSGKDKKNLMNNLPSGYSISKKDDIYEKDSMLFLNKEPFLIVDSDSYIPHLKSLDKGSYSSVYVDRGAIPFVIKGADVMRPGITKIDEFDKDEIILVCDEEHGKVLAVGEALFDSKEMEGMDKGKVVKILHYVGDKYY